MRMFGFMNSTSPSTHSTHAPSGAASSACLMLNGLLNMPLSGFGFARGFPPPVFFCSHARQLDWLRKLRVIRW